MGLGEDIRLTHKDTKKSIKLDFPSRIQMNDFKSLKNYTLHHNGIALLPDFICREEYENKTLVRVLKDWKWKTFKTYFFLPFTKIFLT